MCVCVRVCMCARACVHACVCIRVVYMHLWGCEEQRSRQTAASQQRNINYDPPSAASLPPIPPLFLLLLFLDSTAATPTERRHKPLVPASNARRLLNR